MAKKKKSPLEDEFAKELKKRKIKYDREVHLIPNRRFRTDFVVVLSPRKKYAVECMGGLFRGGRHITGKGYVSDSEKIMLLDKQGYRYLQVCSMSGDNPVSPSKVAEYLASRKN